MNTIVSKFGGSSVADAAQIRKVAAIIREDERRRVVVVSAPGRRSTTDEKITDILIDCYARAAVGDDIGKRFAVVRRRFTEIAQELEIDHKIDTVLDEVEHDIAAGADENLVVSRGEYLSAHLIARYLGFTFVDAAEIIQFSDEHTVDRAACDRLIGAAIDPERRYVIPGFYGMHADGRVQLFSRGGSDVTAALVARGVGAELYENWTDVSGLLSADPRIVKSPTPIERISYDALQELAFLGAIVFHEAAVAPVAEAAIPINIRNTNDPHHAGTLIGTEDGHRIAGVAGKRNLGLLRVSRCPYVSDARFGASLRLGLDAHGARLIQLVSGSDSAVAVVDRPVPPDAVGQIVSELPHDPIIESTPAALVGVVDRDIGADPTRFAQLTTELDSVRIAPRLVAFGYSPRSFYVVVDEDRYEDAVRTFYRTLETT